MASTKWQQASGLELDKPGFEFQISHYIPLPNLCNLKLRIITNFWVYCVDYMRCIGLK